MAAPPAEGRAGGPSLIEALWDGRLGAARWLLGPLLTVPELAFRGVVALRDVAYSTGLLRSRPAPVPAICVGNLTVGGTGKTPMVRWLVAHLAGRGHAPAILHGGYAPDEPALHRQWFPDLTVVADRDRVRGAQAAAGDGADVLVLDDGFQHRRLARDLDVVLVAAERWTPSPRLLPRGPFREPLRALRRADVVVVTRRTAPADAASGVAGQIRGQWDRPTAVAHLGPGRWLAADGSPRSGAPDDPVVCVAGIGRPRAFFRQVREAGVDVAETLAFRDHHSYTAEDAAAIRSLGRDRPVVTTAKDAVKLRSILEERELWVLDQTVHFEEGGAELEDRVERVAG